MNELVDALKWYRDNVEEWQKLRNIIPFIVANGATARLIM
jgi:hypothetical protein